MRSPLTRPAEVMVTLTCEVAGRILCIETDAGLIIRRIGDTTTKMEDA